MNKGSIGAILMGGLSGYMAGRQMNMDEERQAEEMKIRREQLEAVRQDRARAEQERAALDTIRRAGAPTMVETVSNKPATMDDRDVGQPGEAPVPANTYRAGGQMFQDQSGADAAARQYNTTPAALTRMRDAAVSQGRHDMLGQFEPLIKQYQSEGAVQFLRANTPAANVTAEDIKAGRYANVPLVGVQEFNGSGTMRIPEGASAKYVLDDLGRPDFIVVDKDGNQLGGMSGNQLSAIFDYANYKAGRKDRVAEIDKTADNNLAERRHQENLSFQKEEAARREKLERDRMALEERLNRARIAASRDKGPSAPPPTWSDKADKRVTELATSEDPTTGTKTYDPDRELVLRAFALAESERNGGDWNAAIALAERRDRVLQAEAKGDAAALARLRQQSVSALMGRAEQPTANNAPQAAPAAPKPAATMTQVRQQMSRQQARETRAKLQQELERWQKRGDPNADALIREIQGKIDAIDRGEY